MLRKRRVDVVYCYATAVAWCFFLRRTKSPRVSPCALPCPFAFSARLIRAEKRRSAPPRGERCGRGGARGGGSG